MTNPLLHNRSAEGVGYRLQLTRRVWGMQQQAFAERAAINTSAYNQYERGKRLISVAHAHKLCDTFDITMDWIYRGEPSGLRHQTWELIRGLDAHNGHTPT